MYIPLRRHEITTQRRRRNAQHKTTLSVRVAYSERVIVITTARGSESPSHSRHAANSWVQGDGSEQDSGTHFISTIGRNGCEMP